MVNTYGPGMPPRNPAAEAERTRVELRRLQRAALLRQHIESSLVGLLELARIIGAVLLVLELHHLTPVPLWAALVLSFAPNLGSLAALAITAARARYVRWAVARAVR